jgi:hypothetical protein
VATELLAYYRVIKKFLCSVTRHSIFNLMARILQNTANTTNSLFRGSAESPFHPVLDMQGLSSLYYQTRYVMFQP